MPTIEDRYAVIRSAANWKELVKEYAYLGLSDEEIAQVRQSGHEFYRGKVRDLIIEKDRIRLIHSDRLTAFDKFIGVVPYKGVILTSLSSFWLQKVKALVPTHLIATPNPRELMVEKTEPIKVEVVVRGYLAGSMARAYEAGERTYCGETLPDGLATFDKLPDVIITPTTKAAVFEHDENISANDIIAKGICSAQDWETVRSMALQLFHFGSKILEDYGWILVDTKYEFGKNAAGDIILIDEIHTPDSSRFWVKSSYHERLNQGLAPEMLDKEIVRRYLLSQGYKGEGLVPEVPPDVLTNLAEVYLQVAETLEGQKLLVPR